MFIMTSITETIWIFSSFLLFCFNVFLPREGLGAYFAVYVMVSLLTGKVSVSSHSPRQLSAGSRRSKSCPLLNC